jgi:hypothetical protein
MFNIVVKAREFSGKLLPAGEHAVSISEASETVSKVSDFWDDQTPQIECKFKNEEGTLTHWFQLKGFMQAKDYPNGKAPKGIVFRNSENGNEQYAVDLKSNERIEDEAKTDTCKRIISEFIADCGVPEGTKIKSVADAIKAISGAEVGIRVKERGDGKVEYHYAMPIDKVRSMEDAEA